MDIRKIIREEIRGILSEGRTHYWPGYDDDATSDWLSDITRESSKVHNNGLRKADKKIIKDIKDDGDEVWFRHQIANMITTSLQDGFYIDPDLIEKAIEYYEYAIEHAETEEDFMQESARLIIDALKELEPLGKDKNPYYYKPGFMKNDHPNYEKERFSIDKKYHKSTRRELGLLESVLKSKSDKGNRYFKMLKTAKFQHYDMPKGELVSFSYGEDDRKRLVSKLSKADKKVYREWIKTPEGDKSMEIWDRITKNWNKRFPDSDKNKIKECDDIIEKFGCLLNEAKKKKKKPKKRNIFKNYQDNKVPLTDEERAEVMKKKAVWHFSPGNKPSPAVWKSKHPKTGKITYLTHTHRAYNKAPTLKGAIGRFHDFIKGTS